MSWHSNTPHSTEIYEIRIRGERDTRRVLFGLIDAVVELVQDADAVRQLDEITRDVALQPQQPGREGKEEDEAEVENENDGEDRAWLAKAAKEKERERGREKEIRGLFRAHCAAHSYLYEIQRILTRLPPCVADACNNTHAHTRLHESILMR